MLKREHKVRPVSICHMAALRHREKLPSPKPPLLTRPWSLFYFRRWKNDSTFATASF